MLALRYVNVENRHNLREAASRGPSALAYILVSLQVCIYANADVPRDAALRKIDHIALPTKYLPGNKRRSIANCYADREMSVSTTLNDNAQTLHSIRCRCTIPPSLQQIQ